MDFDSRVSKTTNLRAKERNHIVLLRLANLVRLGDSGRFIPPAYVELDDRNSLRKRRAFLLAHREMAGGGADQMDCVTNRIVCARAMTLRK